MTEAEAVEAYSKFAFLGTPLNPEAQAAKLKIQNYIRLKYNALTEGLRAATKWEIFYKDNLSELHREAIRSRNAYPTMPPKA